MESPVEEYPALSRYDDDQARRYEGKRFRSLRGKVVDTLEWVLLRRSLARLRRAAGEVHSIVDVPIGTGRMARRLQAMGFSVTGTDASKDMLEVARGHTSAGAYLVGRIEQLPLADGSVDAVACVRLFGHLPPAAKLAGLQEIHRVARQGAVVFVAGRTTWLEVRRKWQARRGRHLGYWHPIGAAEATALAAQAGFTVSARLRLLGPLAETWALVLVSDRLATGA